MPLAIILSLLILNKDTSQENKNITFCSLDYVKFEGGKCKDKNFYENYMKGRPNFIKTAIFGNFFQNI